MATKSKAARGGNPRTDINKVPGRSSRTGKPEAVAAGKPTAERSTVGPVASEAAKPTVPSEQRGDKRSLQTQADAARAQGVQAGIQAGSVARSGSLAEALRQGESRAAAQPEDGTRQGTVNVIYNGRPRTFGNRGIIRPGESLSLHRWEWDIVHADPSERPNWELQEGQQLKGVIRKPGEAESLGDTAARLDAEADAVQTVADLTENAPVSESFTPTPPAGNEDLHAHAARLKRDAQRAKQAAGLTGHNRVNL